jgi:hypothetical protein
MPASVSSTASALTLLPSWGSMGPWYRAEVGGLSDAQLDFDSQDPAQEWMWWNIRRQTSHVAAMLFRWLFMRWGDTLWEGACPAGGRPARAPQYPPGLAARRAPTRSTQILGD